MGNFAHFKALVNLTLPCTQPQSRLSHLDMSLAGQHAFITGAAKRLGRAMAEALLQSGVHVSAHYHSSLDAMLDLKKWAEKNTPGRVVPIQANLCLLNEVEAAAHQAQAALGPIHILINSASDFYPTPLEALNREDWDQLFNLNLKAPFFLTHHIFKTMPQGGNVIFISDVHGTRPIPRYSTYCATKAGLISLTQSLAKEMAPHIRVNSISPGTLLPSDCATQAQVKAAADRSLLGRVGTPQDLVQGLFFILKHHYITGFDLIIDGGRALS